MYVYAYVTSSRKTRLIEGQKFKALIRRRAFCAASNQSLDLLSHMSICRKTPYRFLHDLKTIYDYKHMEKECLGNTALLLHKPGFRR